MKRKAFLGLAILFIAGLFFAACYVDSKENQSSSKQINEEPEPVDNPQVDDPLVDDPSVDDPPVDDPPVDDPPVDDPPVDDPPVDEPWGKFPLGEFVTYGLDIATEKQIVEYWHDELLYEGMPPWHLPYLGKGYLPGDLDPVEAYYGAYNGYIIVKRGAHSGIRAYQDSFYQFDNIKFRVAYHGLFVWKDGQGHDIEALYQQGLLTQEDILMIYENRFQSWRYGINYITLSYIE